MAFDHAIIDPPGKTISYCIFVFLDPSSKGLQFRKLAAFHLSKPAIEVLASAGAQHVGKLLHQIIGPIDFRVHLAKRDHGLLLLDPQFYRTTKKQEGSLP